MLQVQNSTNIELFKRSISNAADRITLEQFASLLGYDAEHTKRIANGSAKDHEKLIDRWHHWQMMSKAIARVDSEVLAKILSIYG